jgi:putative ABC transport system permease protein
METLLQDLQYAVRRLRRTPGFTFTVVLTLALGIGANSALFSILNGLFWSPPPGVREPGGLTWVSLVEPTRGPLGVSYGDFVAFRDRSGVFDEIAAFQGMPATLGGRQGEPERVNTEMVSASYFSVLRMKPALGRGFVAEEDRAPGERPVAVISHDLWGRRFAGAADVLGREIAVNGTTFNVVGVAAPGFRGLDDVEKPTDLWVPISMRGTLAPSWGDLLALDYGFRSFNAFGRLKAGVSRERAVVPLAGMVRGWAAEFPESYGHVAAALIPFRGLVGPQMGSGGGAISILMLAMGVTVVVLLIACGNVANLLLARAAGRSREIAVRAAIGASRGRIVRQLLVESLVLAVLGGAAGLLLAVWMLALFVRLAPIPFPVPIALDARAVAVTVAVSLLTGIVFGLSPALRASKPELTAALKGGARDGRARSRPQRFLVAAQVALSFMLLVAAGLLVRNMRELLAEDRAIPARNEVLTLAVDLGAQHYSPEKKLVFQRDLLERVSAIAGVRSTSLTDRLPSESFMIEDRIAIDGRVVSDRSSERGERVMMRHTWPAYFATQAIPLLRGRDFSPEDRVGASPVAVVNETAARHFWPGISPRGRRIRIGADSRAAATVVGVVADVADDRPDELARPAVYLPGLQRPPLFGMTTLLVRTQGPAVELAPTIRRAVASLDPALALYDVRTIAQVYDQHRIPQRIGSTLLALFGALALVLAMIGLHGVVAYTVVQRTREMGIRIALGANRRQILALFGGDTLRVAGSGVGVGLLLALAIGKVLSALVRGLAPADLLTLAAVGVLLLGTALLTSLVPARRATRVDPMVALRAE